MNNQNFKCQCGTEMIEVTFEEEDNQFYFTLWSYGYQGHKIPFWGRFRWIWCILRTGLPWTDSVILSSKQAKMLIGFLNNKLKHNPKTVIKPIFRKKQ